MKKGRKRDYQITPELLEEYMSLSLSNSKSLLKESQLLLSHGFYARAYFLSTASIEETGKAFIAFSSLGRNLDDPSVLGKVKDDFESHSKKTSAAFICNIMSGEEANAAVETSVHLSLVREPSMYVDFSESNNIMEPMSLVSRANSESAFVIAKKCFKNTRMIIKEGEAPTSSTYENKVYCMKPKILSQILENSDFHEYLHSLRGQSDFSMSKIISIYYDSYLCKGRKFKT